MVLNIFAALKRRWRSRPFAFAACWGLFVLLPAALVGSGDGVYLARSEIGTASISFVPGGSRDRPARAIRPGPWKHEGAG